MMANLMTGAVFGAALTVSGVWRPSVILSQLRFEEWDMLQTFLAATASSAVIVTAVQRLGYAQLKPRNYASRGWFARYDGNVIGGLLLGAGMALSGTCPGTVFNQVALGVRSGYYALQGGVLAGVTWSGFLGPYLSRCSDSKPRHDKLTLQEWMGTGQTTALAAFESLCAAIIGGTLLLGLTSKDANVSPVLGGFIIGLAQLVSVLARKTLVSVSTSYVELGDWILWPLRGTTDRLPETGTMQFALGISAGTWAVGSYFPFLAEGATSQVAPGIAVLGGFIMVMGSRLAGGCTSGHGLSGLSLLSISSVISIVSAFLGGGLVALFLTH